MKMIGAWTINTNAEGNRQAWRSVAGDVRASITSDKAQGDIVCMRLRCPDAVFEKLRTGEILDASELARVEFLETTEAMPGAVLAALLLP